MESERAPHLFVFRIGLSENRFALFGPMLLRSSPAACVHLSRVRVLTISLIARRTFLCRSLSVQRSMLSIA
jgi:hypothetical protein